MNDKETNVLNRLVVKAVAVLAVNVVLMGEAKAGIPVFDFVNSLSNVVQNWQLAKIKHALAGKGPTTINHYTNNIDKSTTINTELSGDFTWIISVGGDDEDVPIPGEITAKLGAILGKKTSDEYAAGFQSASYYKERPQNNSDDFGIEGSRARKAANDALVKSIEISQESLGREAKWRQKSMDETLKVKGHANQLRVANWLAHTQVDQLMKLRSMMLVSEAARAAEAQASADTDARAIATGHALRDGIASERNQTIGVQPRF